MPTPHTPLPWTLPPVDTGTPWNIEGPNGESIALAFQLTAVSKDPKQLVRHANAAYIVKAANAYPVLRAQLDEAVALLRKMVSHYTNRPHCGHDFTCACKDNDIKELRLFLSRIGESR